jgi:Zn-dependent protease/CBS domain-containing protein
MKWSLKLGTLAGIPVYVHATFALILGWVGLINWLGARSVSAAFGGMMFVLAIFACVVLHELGHALAARRFGVRTRDITLLPIGGVARLERMPRKPIEEFWVAVAGPAVNVIIAAWIFLWLRASASFEPLAALGMAQGSFMERLMWVNILLVGFNMIPAFPMDGGRVLRSLLATRVDYGRATHVAARLGQGFALVFGVLGLFSNPFLLFIAFFVWIGAAQELGAAQMRSALESTPVRHAMLTDFHALRPDDRLSFAIDKTLDGLQRDFPVADEGHVVGILTQDQLMRSLVTGGPSLPVREAMSGDFTVAEPDQMLESAMERMPPGKTTVVPVLENGRLVGLLTMKNVTEFVRFREALRSGRSAAGDDGSHEDRRGTGMFPSREVTETP